jgi:hypothetical protein
MKTLATLSLSAVVLAALPGCILVATDHDHCPATKQQLEAVRQVEPTEGAPTVRTVYHDQISKLTPGMSIDAFKTSFPAALFVEQREDSGRKLDAYSIKLNEPYRVRGENVISTARDEAWFYFKDGQFVKWGEPKNWP